MEKTTELEQTLAMALSLSTLDKVRLVERIMLTLEHDLIQADPHPKRSLAGLWAGVNISEEDIAEARREMCNPFPDSVN